VQLTWILGHWPTNVLQGSSVTTFQGISTTSPPANRQDPLASAQRIPEPSAEASMQSTYNVPIDRSPEQTLPDPPTEALMQATLNAPIGPGPEQTLPTHNRRLPARY
jgi:hypothetical protein